MQGLFWFIKLFNDFVVSPQLPEPLVPLFSMKIVSFFLLQKCMLAFFFKILYPFTFFPSYFFGPLTLSLPITRSLFSGVKLLAFWSTDEALNAVHLYYIPILNATNGIWKRNMSFKVSVFECPGSNSDLEEMSALKFLLFESPGKIWILELNNK